MDNEGFVLTVEFSKWLVATCAIAIGFLGQQSKHLTRPFQKVLFLISVAAFALSIVLGGGVVKEQAEIVQLGLLKEVSKEREVELNMLRSNSAMADINYQAVSSKPLPPAYSPDGERYPSSVGDEKQRTRFEDDKNTKKQRLDEETKKHETGVADFNKKQKAMLDNQGLQYHAFVAGMILFALAVAGLLISKQGNDAKDAGD
ncbi:MAG: hypothetical protein QOJ65_2180 [Fimbriimonadaceae bacterium]|jgi:uncharacterized membrane protein YcjF (UPF0283 family)|nr:hypothetical protein [Fimbriimonadaceae bacterium]